MPSMAADRLATSPETEPEQLSASPGTPLAEPPAPTQPARLRTPQAAQCALCGIARPLGLLVPDGGQACADIRWYCKDTKSCTERWTTARQTQHAHPPAVPRTTLAGNLRRTGLPR
jgi:hypothetical protein